MNVSAKPVILLVDSEGDSSDTVEQLVIRYSHDYTIVVEPDVASASQRLRALHEAASDVALILADRASNGAMLLDEARMVHPHVTILVRGESLAQSMSEYLITEIEATPNIDLMCGVEVVGGAGDGRLETIDIRRPSSGAVDRRPAAALFVLIGAEPFTHWLPSDVARDNWGFVITGPSQETPSRLPFESTLPGVFAVGDVRRDSTKRVASAAGEGAVCVRLVHQYLAAQRDL